MPAVEFVWPGWWVRLGVVLRWWISLAAAEDLAWPWWRAAARCPHGRVETATVTGVESMRWLRLAMVPDVLVQALKDEGGGGVVHPICVMVQLVQS